MNGPIVRRAASLLLVAGAALAAGCGRGSGNPEPRAGGVEVVNSILPGTTATVWLLSSSGTRELLGVVPPRRTRVLPYRTRVTAGLYRLELRTATGQAITSNTLQLAEGQGIRWDLDARTAVAVTP